MNLNIKKNFFSKKRQFFNDFKIKNFFSKKRQFFNDFFEI